ncbi:hypothetical protein K503DRAFT_96562 [Rhizopogon vinicolor AM-OR11-026]|uniref:Uncharacterized protein n=1 Tax=Rhizopogon vinicolor AM-OR11-026 TaxID=1314800 RepID=A0A1B7N3D2_9AGAM|nr:hypothetical protein K503DRAFT_96562 [Rhizopogon vinicolor AM-OR11-026]
MVLVLVLLSGLSPSFLPLCLLSARRWVFNALLLSPYISDSLTINTDPACYPLCCCYCCCCYELGSCACIAPLLLSLMFFGCIVKMSYIVSCTPLFMYRKLSTRYPSFFIFLSLFFIAVGPSEVAVGIRL